MNRDAMGITVLMEKTVEKSEEEAPKSETEEPGKAINDP